jgi:cytochrome d oxidase subunit CydB
MDLNTVWFILVTILFIGFFFLEGFDYGVGILLPFLGKDDGERRAIINSIGPVWDGNEVWMITAGGALFASFPNVYATLFSGFYLALVLMLVALIMRGVAFEFRGKSERKSWRALWGLGYLHRQPASGLAVGRDGGEPDAGFCHRAGYELLRRFAAAAQPVCVARRIGLRVPVYYAWRELLDP